MAAQVADTAGEIVASEIPGSPWHGLALQDCDDAQREFAFEDELGLFRMLLQWWAEPGDATFYETA